MSGFLNLSNHHSSRWSQEQLQCANKYGDVVDMEFPAIDAQASAEEISSLAEQYAADISARFSPLTDAVHIMGEMTFTYALVRRLRECGFTCLASTTQRIKQLQPDGTFISEFRFQTFRPYE